MLAALENAERASQARRSREAQADWWAAAPRTRHGQHTLEVAKAAARPRAKALRVLGQDEISDLNVAAMPKLCASLTLRVLC